MRLALGRTCQLASLALLVAACGAAKRAAPPPNPPRPPLPGPPPAWAETEAGSRWLGYSTYCWRGGCADYGLPMCPKPRHVPTFRLYDKETVRFHLGFEPREVSLSLYRSGVERPLRQTLEKSRTPSWTVKPAQLVVLFARPKVGGDVSYVACLEVGGAV